MYDFTTMRPRLDVGAEKWHGIEQAGIDDPTVIPFSVADMDLLTAPAITAALCRAAEFGVYGYTSADSHYLAAVQGWMARRHGWDIAPEWVVTTYGVVHAIIQSIHAFTQEGDGVVIQPPVYPPFTKCVVGAGRNVVENPLILGENGYEMDFDGLEAVCALPTTKLMLLCSPHNPVGRVWRREELERVHTICQKHGVLVFADEIHCDFVKKPNVHTVFATLGQSAQDNVIVATSASKTFNLAGLTAANIIIPNATMRQKFQSKTMGYTGPYTGFFGLKATRVAYESCEDWLEELLEHIWENEALCRQFFAEKFPSATVLPLEGTYLLWVDLRSLGLEPREQEKFMTEKALLWLDEGDMFGQAGACYERINLACPRDVLAAALERLDQAATQCHLPR